MARPRLLPALFGARPHVEDKTLGIDPERKVILSGYYAALAAAGIGPGSGDRSRAWPVERAVAEGYERVVWCFRPVNVISGNSARLRFGLKDGENEVDDHPLFTVLNKQANPMETARVFRKRLSAQVLLSKRGAFVEATKSNRGSIIRYDLLPPGRTKVIPGTGNDPIAYFEVTPIGGGNVQKIDPADVRWVRDPHPLDPYSGTTPLESAGMSVELDYFARLYNVTFMRNDGRPGGILGVKAPEKGGGDMDEEEMDRLEARFGKGPVEAGKLSVISGDLSYVDVASKPRDLQYAQTSKNAKTEMLVAFGVPESQLGNAADRTFANADAEGYAFWTQTMAEHNEIILSAFEIDSEEPLTGFLDTSKIEVLQRAEIAARAEAREEVAAGLRSIRSYALLSGQEDEIDDTPFTRALYIAAGKTPLPSKEGDAEALGISQGPAADASAAPGATDPNAAPGDTAPAVGTEGAGSSTSGGAGDSGTSAVPVAATPAATDNGGAEVSLFDETKSLEGKALDPSRHLSVVRPHRRVALSVEAKSDSADAEGDQRDSEVDDGLRESLEADVAKALSDLGERQMERALARLKSPAQRKGTRHWEAQYAVDTRIGTKALDASKIAGEDPTPAEEQQEGSAVRTLLEVAAVAAAIAMISDLTQTTVKTPPAKVMQGITKTLDATMKIIFASFRRQRSLIADQINGLDQAGKSVDEIAAAVRATDRHEGWAEGLAVQAATATLEGTREAVAVTLPDAEKADLVRVWMTRRDERVRHSHVEADGQQRKIGEPFLVGEALLRYPGDPLAPFRETANCRCHLKYRSKSSGRYASKPADEINRRTG